jgi:hypothetical protein
MTVLLTHFQIVDNTFLRDKPPPLPSISTVLKTTPRKILTPKSPSRCVTRDSGYGPSSRISYSTVNALASPAINSSIEPQPMSLPPPFEMQGGIPNSTTLSEDVLRMEARIQAEQQALMVRQARNERMPEPVSVGELRKVPHHMETYHSPQQPPEQYQRVQQQLLLQQLQQQSRIQPQQQVGLQQRQLQLQGSKTGQEQQPKFYYPQEQQQQQQQYIPPVTYNQHPLYGPPNKEPTQQLQPLTSQLTTASWVRSASPSLEYHKGHNDVHSRRSPIAASRQMPQIRKENPSVAPLNRPQRSMFSGVMGPPPELPATPGRSFSIEYSPAPGYAPPEQMQQVEGWQSPSSNRHLDSFLGQIPESIFLGAEPGAAVNDGWPSISITSQPYLLLSDRMPFGSRSTVNQTDSTNRDKPNSSSMGADLTSKRREDSAVNEFWWNLDMDFTTMEGTLDKSKPEPRDSIRSRSARFRVPPAPTSRSAPFALDNTGTSEIQPQNLKLPPKKVKKSRHAALPPDAPIEMPNPSQGLKTLDTVPRSLNVSTGNEDVSSSERTRAIPGLGNLTWSLDPKAEQTRPALQRLTRPVSVRSVVTRDVTYQRKAGIAVKGPSRWSPSPSPDQSMTLEVPRRAEDNDGVANTTGEPIFKEAGDLGGETTEGKCEGEWNTESTQYNRPITDAAKKGNDDVEMRKPHNASSEFTTWWSRSRGRAVVEEHMPGRESYLIDDGGPPSSTETCGQIPNLSWGVIKAGKPRKRLAQACLACREGGIKCNGQAPKCVQCQENGRDCNYKPVPRATALVGGVEACQALASIRTDSDDSIVEDFHRSANLRDFDASFAQFDQIETHLETLSPEALKRYDQPEFQRELPLVKETQDTKKSPLPSKPPLPSSAQPQEPKLYSEMTLSPPNWGRVNQKQYERMLKRRIVRRALDKELGHISKLRGPSLHESRHSHAIRRIRGPGGRFLTAGEVRDMQREPLVDAEAKPDASFMAESFSPNDEGTPSDPSCDDEVKYGYLNENGTWSCNYPRCDYRGAFIRLCDLRKHYKHHARGVFCRHEDCPQNANGGFASKKDRDRHEARHISGVACEWDGCGRVFTIVESMRDHAKRIHRQEQVDFTVPHFPVVPAYSLANDDDHLSDKHSLHLDTMEGSEGDEQAFRQERTSRKAEIQSKKGMPSFKVIRLEIMSTCQYSNIATKTSTDHFRPSRMDPVVDTVPETEDAAPAQKMARSVAKSRSKTGCITCRRRKEKCDATKPFCLNCQKNAVVCEGYPPREIWKSGKQNVDEAGKVHPSSDSVHVFGRLPRTDGSRSSQDRNGLTTSFEKLKYAAEPPDPNDTPMEDVISSPNTELSSHRFTIEKALDSNGEISSPDYFIYPGAAQPTPNTRSADFVTRPSADIPDEEVLSSAPALPMKQDATQFQEHPMDLDLDVSTTEPSKPSPERSSMADLRAGRLPTSSTEDHPLPFIGYSYKTFNAPSVSSADPYFPQHSLPAFTAKYNEQANKFNSMSDTEVWEVTKEGNYTSLDISGETLNNTPNVTVATSSTDSSLPGIPSLAASKAPGSIVEYLSLKDYGNTEATGYYRSPPSTNTGSFPDTLVPTAPPAPHGIGRRLGSRSPRRHRRSNSQILPTAYLQLDSGTLGPAPPSMAEPQLPPKSTTAEISPLDTFPSAIEQTSAKIQAVEERRLLKTRKRQRTTVDVQAACEMFVTRPSEPQQQSQHLIMPQWPSMMTKQANYSAPVLAGSTDHDSTGTKIGTLGGNLDTQMQGRDPVRKRTGGMKRKNVETLAPRTEVYAREDEEKEEMPLQAEEENEKGSGLDLVNELLLEWTVLDQETLEGLNKDAGVGGISVES